MSKHLLITGGAGYIGSHTVKLLSEHNYKITVIDNLVYGHEEAIPPNIRLIKGDIGDLKVIEPLFESNEFDAVLHFAAYAYVGESVQNPSKYYHNNLQAPLNLLDTMVKYNCRNFIFSSTCATYGNPQYVPIDEKHPQNPINPYGMSKLMLEKIIMDYQKAYGMQYVFLRYFNASGAAKDGSIGEDHNPETHLIPLILDAANGDRDNITVFGTDYDTPDGSCIRDYIHVNDLATAHEKALQHLLAGKPSVAVNLGTGKGHSVLEVIRAVEKTTGKKVPVVFGERREGDPPQLVANAEKAAKVLGWKAAITDLNEIVRDAWAWKSGPKKGHY